MSVEENAPVGAIVPVIAPAVVDAVEADVRRICTRYAARLQFHGWHHVSFVRTKAARFAVLNGAEVSVVETAALVHDVNYLVRSNSSAAAGSDLRLAILARAGVAPMSRAGSTGSSSRPRWPPAAGTSRWRRRLCPTPTPCSRRCR